MERIVEDETTITLGGNSGGISFSLGILPQYLKKQQTPPSEYFME
jgi:hypothetical protein